MVYTAQNYAESSQCQALSLWQQHLQLLITELVGFHDVVKLLVIPLHVLHEVWQTSIVQLSESLQPFSIFKRNLQTKTQLFFF